MRMETSCYINHNRATSQCETRLSQCESLQPAVGTIVNAFGLPRHGCLHWVHSQVFGGLRTHIKVRDRYIARMTSGDVVLIGTFHVYVDDTRQFWANREGVQTSPVSETEEDIEILMPAALCHGWPKRQVKHFRLRLSLVVNLLMDQKPMWRKLCSTIMSMQSLVITTQNQLLRFMRPMVAIQRPHWKYKWCFEA